MYEKLKINNLRKEYLELINYEISYKHYVELMDNKTQF
jgi:hypothetical protein